MFPNPIEQNIPLISYLPRNGKRSTLVVSLIATAGILFKIYATNLRFKPSAKFRGDSHSVVLPYTRDREVFR